MAAGAVLLLAVAYVHGQQFGNQPATRDLIKVKDDLFVIHNPFVPGTLGAMTPMLIDYPGGGSAKDWTATLDRALELDFDTVVPGHGDVTTTAELRKFRDLTLAMRTRVHEMLVQKKTEADIAAVLKSDFQGAQLVFTGLLPGLPNELQ